MPRLHPMRPSRSTCRQMLISAAAAILVVLLPIADSALAQGGFRGGRGDNEPMRRGGGMGGMRGLGGFGQALQPEFLARDIPLMVDALSLDEGQALILEALFADYSADFQAGSGVVNESMREIGPRLFRSFMTPQVRERFGTAMEEVEGDIRRAAEAGETIEPDAMRQRMEQRMLEIADEIRAERQASGEEAETQRIMGEMVTGLDTWRQQRQEMRTRLIDGIKAQLNDQQLEMWPIFERRFDRMKSLPNGQLSGESTDLILVIDRLGLPQDVLDQIDRVLEDYEIAIDTALKARNDYLAQSEPRLLRSVQDLDMRTGMDIVRRQMQQRVALRDVNEQYRVAIADALPSGQREIFAEAAASASFDRIFRPTRADRVFEMVRGFDDISEETLRQIDMIEETFRMELAQFNERLITLTKRHEPEAQIAEAERFAAMIAGGGQQGGRRGDDPVREAYNERQELVDRHIQLLAGVLTPEQFQSIPVEPQRRRMGGGFDNLPPELQERILAAVDRNGNGVIDPEEQAEAFRMMREMWRERGAQRD